MKIKVFLESTRDFAEHQLLCKFYEIIPEETTVDWELTDIESEIMHKEIDIGDSYSDCDIAVMFGSWKPREKGHHLVRNAIVQNAPCFIMFETPLLRRSVHKVNDYYRVGVNGFLNNQGSFTPNKLNYSNDRLLNKLKLSWDGWKQNSQGHILMLLQLPGDASLRGPDIYNWLNTCIGDIREQTNKKIVIRPHPLSPMRETDLFFKTVTELYMEGIKNIEVSDPSIKSLKEDLNGAYCSVTFTSGSAVDSIMAGIPTVATDPGNFAWDISTNFCDEINNVLLEDPKTVQQWLSNLAYYQWDTTEIKSGAVWKHIWEVAFHELRHKKAQNILRAEKGKKK